MPFFLPPEVTLPRNVRESFLFAKVSRLNATQWTLSPLFTSQDFIYIGTQNVDLTPVFTGDTTDNLITATGLDSGGAALANTLYYIYLSSGIASFAPLETRLSATAPTQNFGYLAASGNGANWRHVGVLYTNGAAQIASDWNVCGRGEDTFYANLTGDFTIVGGSANQYHTLTDLTLQNFVFLPSTKLIMFSAVDLGYTAGLDRQVNIQQSFGGAVNMSQLYMYISGTFLSVTLQAQKLYAAFGQEDLLTQMFFDGGVDNLMSLASVLGRDATYVNVQRIS